DPRAIAAGVGPGSDRPRMGTVRDRERRHGRDGAGDRLPPLRRGRGAGAAGGCGAAARGRRRADPHRRRRGRSVGHAAAERTLPPGAPRQAALRCRLRCRRRRRGRRPGRDQLPARRF
ncbi:MAG: hypothetical protein AVDCRST_MAG19-2173, partial [uncultured Thermomicrobiales bacterium]